MISSVFTCGMIRDTLIGPLTVIISAGNPITSYIIGGKLLKVGVSLFAVTAFIVDWLPFGVVQYPVKSDMLRRRFAFFRNGILFKMMKFF